MKFNLLRHMTPCRRELLSRRHGVTSRNEHRCENFQRRAFLISVSASHSVGVHIWPRCHRTSRQSKLCRVSALQCSWQALSISQCNIELWRLNWQTNRRTVNHTIWFIVQNVLHVTVLTWRQRHRHNSVRERKQCVCVCRTLPATVLMECVTQVTAITKLQPNLT